MQETRNIPGGMSSITDSSPERKPSQRARPGGVSWEEAFVFRHKKGVVLQKGRAKLGGRRWAESERKIARRGERRNRRKGVEPLLVADNRGTGVNVVGFNRVKRRPTRKTCCRTKSQQRLCDNLGWGKRHRVQGGWSNRVDWVQGRSE